MSKAVVLSTDTHSILPRRGRGRVSASDQTKYEADLRAFVDLMIQIQSSMKKKVSSRGWCYVLEPYGLLKSDFDSAQKLINDCRKNGMLPCGFTLEDDARVFHCGEKSVSETTDPTEEAEGILNYIPQFYRQWNPFSFHDDQDYYIQMLVEKIDLRELFSDICEKYYVPIANTRGWSSIGQREEMILRFKKYEDQGKTCVLLYCGDFDPAGLQISNVLRKNINDLSLSTGWCADNLIIDRFGLNGDFINDNHLTWIDNLQTGGKGQPPLNDPRHEDHNKRYVQDYLKTWGIRKCEANALVVNPDLGECLCEVAINKYIPEESLNSYLGLIKQKQAELGDEIKRLVQEGYLESLFEEVN